MNHVKTIVFPVFNWNVHRLERRLTKEASDGYRLTACKGWRLYFDKTAGKEREYFVYDPIIEKNDRFLEEYFLYESAYRLRKSPIKENKRAPFLVFEVDEKKKDKLFRYIYQERDRHYFAFYRRTTIASLVVGTVMAVFEAVPAMRSVLFLVLLILSGIAFAYFLFCMLFFGKRMNAYRNVQ